MVSRFFRREVFAVLFALYAPAMLHGQTTGVAWRTNLDAAKIEAAQTGRLLLLHFYTQSCGPCKALDAAVLNQPQVGAAVEQSYVPVKIDAEASEAIARMFRIDRVPTEVVLTPEGRVVAVLSTPQVPDKYVEQLQDVATHVRSQTPNSGSSAPPAPVNSAYASLPASVAANRTTTPPVVPQQQSNPYVAAPPSLQGQGAASQSESAPPISQQGVTTADVNVATSTPAMPNNAMPQSFRGAAGSVAPSNVGTPGAVAAGAGAVAATTTPSAVAPSNAPATTVAGPSAPAGAVRTQQPALPANSPPVAFDGCCPVTLKMQNKWEVGNTQFGAVHRGRTYLFVSDQQRQQFLADPDSYSPVFAGYDPVLLLDKQQSVPGTRRHGFRYGGAFYLFSTPETMARFKASPQVYAAGVRQAMARIDGAASGTILR
jgi:YHS domain-containing protein/thiol-disulfide isomerase/thioredoxin